MLEAACSSPAMENVLRCSPAALYDNTAAVAAASERAGEPSCASFDAFLGTLLKPTVTNVMLDHRQGKRYISVYLVCASTQGESWPILCTPWRRTSAVKIV